MKTNVCTQNNSVVVKVASLRTNVCSFESNEQNLLLVVCSDYNSCGMRFHFKTVSACINDERNRYYKFKKRAVSRICNEVYYKNTFLSEIISHKSKQINIRAVQLRQLSHPVFTSWLIEPFDSIS